MPNPLDVITSARRRIATLAALRAALYPLIPAATCIVLALATAPFGSLIASATGYALGPQAESNLRWTLLSVAALTIVAGAAWAYLEYRRADDYLAAAERVDELVRGRQEVLTLASLAGASSDDAAGRRSSLFPVLVRRASTLLERFVPEQALKLDARDALVRSSIAAGVLALMVGVSMLGLLRTPSALERSAARLREIASSLESPSASVADRALGQAARDAADAIANSNLPPEEKRRRIELAIRLVDDAAGSGAQQNKKSGGADQEESKMEANPGRPGSDPTARRKGGGGETREGKGSDTGAGEGKERGAKGPSSGEKKEGDKTEASQVEIRNELEKAMAQIETEGSTGKNPQNKPGNEKNGAKAPQPGPDQAAKGGANRRDDSGSKVGAKQDQSAEDKQRAAEQPGGEQPKDSGQGNTKLGEIPAPANYQRFLKPGDKGAKVDIQDARYVMFRLPTGVVSGAGRTVEDTARPKAATPYTNAPLKASNDTAPPDERQLVPPRYRDLIR
ncbi:MAG: hypothetical protein ACREQF_06235 [Candidatus Binataceae bacterium]